MDYKLSIWSVIAFLTLVRNHDTVKKEAQLSKLAQLLGGSQTEGIVILLYNMTWINEARKREVKHLPNWRSVDKR